MKRGCPSHPKTFALADALRIERWGAVGILESLWHFAAQYARRGDVGRHSDPAIANAIGWGGDPEKLVRALVESGWLKPCPCHRLRVHDWPEHADQGTHKSKDVVKDGFIECYDNPDPEPTLSLGSAYPQPTLSPTSAIAEPTLGVKQINAPLAMAKATATEQGTGLRQRLQTADEVFEHWRASMGKEQAKFTKERRSRVEARLKEGYTPEQLKAAVDGCLVSPHHQGQNDTKTVYDDLELICRTGSHVERFIGYLRPPPQAGPQGLAGVQAAGMEKARKAIEAQLSGVREGDEAARRSLPQPSHERG